MANRFVVIYETGNKVAEDVATNLVNFIRANRLILYDVATCNFYDSNTISFSEYSGTYKIELEVRLVYPLSVRKQDKRVVDEIKSEVERLSGGKLFCVRDDNYFDKTQYILSIRFAGHNVFGMCDCGSNLVRNNEGHLVCSNPACPNHNVHSYSPIKRNFWKFRHDTSALEYTQGWRTGDNFLHRNARINLGKLKRHGGDTWYNLRNRSDVRNRGVQVREDDQREPEKRQVEMDAVEQFRAGTHYSDAVNNLIAKYSAEGWWTRKKDENRYVIRLQKNEVKEIVLMVYHHPERYGISQYEIYHDETIKKAQDSVRGFGGAFKRMSIGFGIWSNKSSIGKIASLQERLRCYDNDEKELEKQLKNPNNTEDDIRRFRALLDVKKEEIKETLEKIRLIEEHPELAKRMNVRTGGFLRNGYRSIKGGFRGHGGKIVSAWSAHKEKIISAIQLLLPVVVFGLMFYYSWSVRDLFPVGPLSMFIFILVALLCGAVKSSMSDDKSDMAEAREIVSIIVVIGTILALLANGFTWVALIFCLIMGIYIFFDFITDSLVFSIVMFFIMFFVISLTMSGWMDILGIETEKVAQQTGFYEAITTSMGALSAGLGDVWFMISDPYGWQTKQQMEAAAKKGEGETDRALEIKTVRVTPSIINQGDEAMIMVEVENFGREDATRPARDAVVYLKRITEYDNPAFNLELDGGTDLDVKYIGDILSGTGAQEGFDVVAPSGCVGTFRLQAGVHYGYDVDAIGDVFVIDRERYGELTNQDQLDSEKQVTKSTSGPVSVSLKTNLPQPIPVVKGCNVGGDISSCKTFSLFFGIMNTRSSNGIVTVKDVEIEMPKQFKPRVVRADLLGNDEYSCRLCLRDAAQNIYTIKSLYGDDIDSKDTNPLTDCLDKKPSDVLDVTGDMNIFKCDMYYDGGSDEDVYFKKPLNVKVNIDYEYNSTKDVSFSVRKQMADDPATVLKCSN